MLAILKESSGKDKNDDVIIMVDFPGVTNLGTKESSFDAFDMDSLVVCVLVRTFFAL